MPKARPKQGNEKLTQVQIEFLKERMSRLADRNPSWGVKRNDYKELYLYLAAQKITFLYDDELFEGLKHVDQRRTGKSEELLDAYLILDQGEEIELKLFQFKFTDAYDRGISTKDLYAFVDRMNRVFLHTDLQDATSLEAFKEVRDALSEAKKANKLARRTRIQCYYIVNGQNVSRTDVNAGKIQEIRDTFSHDRQTYGFTFETYGGAEIYNLCAYGRIPIQEEQIEINHDAAKGSFLHHNIGPNPNGMPEQVLVGFANVNQFTRLVDRYSNNELFEKNVRLFLGSGKEVNRRIIETVTGLDSAWFGYMNNGVSITAETLVVDMPPTAKKARVTLRGMQIINGCQTANALYHAKYAPELKDRFQGNSNVLVRIYQIAPENKAFLDALIVATNSQNAIRPEDLLSNDNIQKAFQTLYHDYRIGYERKEGETLPGHEYLMTFTKEQAGMAYLAVFMGYSSKLRNTFSRREFFRQGDDYYKVFNLRGAEGDNSPGPLPDDFETDEASNHRALQILAARCLEDACRKGIKAIPEKQARSALKKGAYYLARIIYLRQQSKLDRFISDSSAQDRSHTVARKLIDSISAIAGNSFGDAVKVFQGAWAEYTKETGLNEDAVLKNSAFAKRVDDLAETVTP